MDIRFNFKSFEPSDYLKDYIQNRFEKLGKYFKNTDNNNILIQINLEVEKFRQIAEVILNADEVHLSAQDETEDMYATVDSVLDKIESQLRKLRGKQKEKRRNLGSRTDVSDNRGSLEAAATESFPNVTYSDRYESKPMDIYEAVNQLHNMNQDFLVFFNSETNRVNVVYRRKNGDYGVIDPRM